MSLWLIEFSTEGAPGWNLALVEAHTAHAAAKGLGLDLGDSSEWPRKVTFHPQFNKPAVRCTLRRKVPLRPREGNSWNIWRLRAEEAILCEKPVNARDLFERLQAAVVTKRSPNLTLDDLEYPLNEPPEWEAESRKGPDPMSTILLTFPTAYGYNNVVVTAPGVRAALARIGYGGAAVDFAAWDNRAAAEGIRAAESSPPIAPSVRKAIQVRRLTPKEAANVHSAADQTSLVTQINAVLKSRPVPDETISALCPPPTKQAAPPTAQPAPANPAAPFMEAPTMSKPETTDPAPPNGHPLLKTLKTDATDAAWRTAGSQFIKLAREPLVALLSRHLGPDDEALRGRIARFLETELGTAMLTALLSVGLSSLPSTGSPIPEKLARELRIRSMADTADVVADVIAEPLRKVMAAYLQGVEPELQGSPTRTIDGPRSAPLRVEHVEADAVNAPAAKNTTG